MKLHHFLATARPFFLLSCLATLLFAGCSYTEKLTDGKTAYDRKYYAEAVRLLQREFNATKITAEKAQKAFLIADAYSHFGKTTETKKWIQTAIDNNYGPDAQLALAYLLKREGSYTEAAKTFDLLGKELGEATKYRKEVSACRIAATWLADAPKSGVVLEKLPINTVANDFAPIQDKAGNLMFVSDRTRADADPKKGDPIYGWTGRTFAEWYRVEKTDGTQPFEAFNSPYNEGAACFNSTYSEFYFTRCGSAQKEGIDYCKIMVSKAENGENWSQPEEVKTGIEGYNVQHPCLTADNKRLYFSTDMPEGSGGYDIFYIEKKADNSWSEWRNAGRTINTSGNEFFPTLDADTLYFASDGHTGMGGLDVFSSVSVKGKWQPPLNLKAPINSGEDDFGFVMDKTFERPKNNNPEKSDEPSKATSQKILQRAYFTSSRGGNDDIYKVEKRTLPPPPIVVVTTPKDPVPTVVYKQILEVTVVKKKFAIADNPNSKVVGFEPITAANLKIESDDTTRNVVLNDKGQVTFYINENNTYDFLAEKPSFFSKTASFNTGLVEKNPKQPVTLHKLTVVLDQIFENQEIVLDNIYYDYDKAEIRADAQPTLNELGDVLRRNPTINIQLSSHTDCRGRDTYNLTLSQNRAQAAVNYLIARGIAATRLSAKGYGETVPAATCDCAKCTEAEHQINRRTTFKVLKTE